MEGIFQRHSQCDRSLFIPKIPLRSDPVPAVLGLYLDWRHRGTRVAGGAEWVGGILRSKVWF